MAFYTVIATLLVAPWPSVIPGGIPRVLASRPMVWLGRSPTRSSWCTWFLMEISMTVVLHWRVYTGNTATLFAVTMALSIPVAWVLHRFTQVHR